MRYVRLLPDGVNVDGMAPVPQRNPRPIRLVAPELLLSAVEVDDLLEPGAKAARGGFEREGLRDRSAGLVDSRREREGRRRDGQVGPCRG